MSDKPKRKQPSKADLVEQAISLGVDKSAVSIEALTVKEIRALIGEYKQGYVKPEIVVPTAPNLAEQYEINIQEITEPNCGHIFRKVREIHRTGNIIVNICNICGWREIVG